MNKLKTIKTKKMKAIVNQSNLLTELKKVSPVIKKNTVIPILSSVKFDFSKNKLTITATDLETTFITAIDCDCQNDFSINIEYTDILEVCSNVNAPIEINVEGKTINVKSGKSKFKFSLIGDTANFPNTPTDDFDIEINADCDFFYNLSNANLFRAKEDTRVNLNMAAIDIQKSKLCVVGCDGNYLYKKELPISSKKERMVMVCDMFIQSCKAFQDSKISVGEKFIKVESNNETVISRLSDNKFVNYNVIIPAEINYNITIDTNELKSALRTVTIAANLISKQCVFNFLESGVKLNSQNTDFAKEAESEIDVAHQVEIDAICLNSSQLLLILNNIKSETVDISFASFDKTVYIKPSDDNSILCLLQPLTLTNN